MNDDREELAGLIRRVPDDTDLALAIADAILAAGYHKPAVVTTAEEVENVDALPDGTVILDSQGEAWQKDRGMWYLAAGGYLDKGPADYLPATVLHFGGAQ